jgi:hypothetical protein
LVVIHLLELARAAEKAREAAFAVVAQHVHEEQPVLGLCVAGAERERLVGVAVDVRDVVRVAVDRDAGLGLLGAGDVGLPDPERLVVVVVAERRVGEGRIAVQQVVVLAELVLAVRRTLLQQLEPERVERVDQTVLAGRQDAHGLPVRVVVGAVGVRRSARRRGDTRRRRGREGADHQCTDTEHGRSDPAPGRHHPY